MYIKNMGGGRTDWGEGGRGRGEDVGRDGFGRGGKGRKKYGGREEAVVGEMEEWKERGKRKGGELVACRYLVCL